jgi:hypothetical protein
MNEGKFHRVYWLLGDSYYVSTDFDAPAQISIDDAPACKNALLAERTFHQIQLSLPSSIIERAIR